MVRDEQSGKYGRTRLFVMTLGYSRKSVRLLVFRCSSRVWAEPHEKAFGRMGGSPRVVVLDNAGTKPTAKRTPLWLSTAKPCATPLIFRGVKPIS
jgi:transposase